MLKRHPGVGGDSIGTELGRLAYWLVWLVGLIAALQPLGLSGVLTPVTALTNEVFAFLPKLLGAGPILLRGTDPGAGSSGMSLKLRLVRSTSSGCSAGPASASAMRR